VLRRRLRRRRTPTRAAQTPARLRACHQPHPDMCQARSAARALGAKVLSRVGVPGFLAWHRATPLVKPALSTLRASELRSGDGKALRQSINPPSQGQQAYPVPARAGKETQPRPRRVRGQQLRRAHLARTLTLQFVYVPLRTWRDVTWAFFGLIYLCEPTRVRGCGPANGRRDAVGQSRPPSTTALRLSDSSPRLTCKPSCHGRRAAGDR
jgi:hypothetical protein